jgi:hypothetical protein
MPVIKIREATEKRLKGFKGYEYSSYDFLINAALSALEGILEEGKGGKEMNDADILSQVVTFLKAYTWIDVSNLNTGIKDGAQLARWIHEEQKKNDV